MSKVVFNNRIGSFGLSDAALKLMFEMGSEYVKENPNYNAPNEYGNGITKKWWEPKYILDWNCPRHDNILVDVVSKLNHLANGPEASLQLATVVSQYIIETRDGLETVVQPQEINWITASNRLQIFS